MIYKLFIEDGEYRDRRTKEGRNLVVADIAYTPEGINVGWDEFNSLEDAIYSYDIELKPKEIE
jgi:hypothetical protein